MAEDSRSYWNRKIIEWEDSVHSGKGLSPVEMLASRFRKPLVRRAQIALRLLAPHVEGATVLELGCGSGFFARELIHRVGARHVTGVDFSSNAIRRAHEDAERDGLGGRLTFVESDASRVAELPAADFTIGLGFLDYLSPSEVTSLFRDLRSKHFLFTFSERRPSLLRYAHIAYLRSQRCPKHYYFTRDEILRFVGPHFGTVRFVSGPEMSFGCIVHNLADGTNR